jgi:hypothetical protein
MLDMKCPVCDQPVRDRDQECVCGELLPQWRLIAASGEALRQRGLVLASQGDYVGACISFLEAALTNPLDGGSVVDAAKALFHLGRPDDALRLLRHVDAANGVASVTRAIETLMQDSG